MTRWIRVSPNARNADCSDRAEAISRVRTIPIATAPANAATRGEHPQRDGQHTDCTVRSLSLHRDRLRIEVRRQRREDPPRGRHDSRHIDRGIAGADAQQRAEITDPIGVRAVERGGEDHDTTCCALDAEIERPAIDTDNSQSHVRTEVGAEVTDALVEAGDLCWGERLRRRDDHRHRDATGRRVSHRS